MKTEALYYKTEDGSFGPSIAVYDSYEEMRLIATYRISAFLNTLGASIVSHAKTHLEKSRKSNITMLPSYSEVWKNPSKRVGELMSEVLDEN